MKNSLEKVMPLLTLAAACDGGAVNAEQCKVSNDVVATDVQEVLDRISDVFNRGRLFSGNESSITASTKNAFVECRRGIASLNCSIFDAEDKGSEGFSRDLFPRTAIEVLRNSEAPSIRVIVTNIDLVPHGSSNPRYEQKRRVYTRNDDGCTVSFDKALLETSIAEGTPGLQIDVTPQEEWQSDSECHQSCEETAKAIAGALEHTAKIGFGPN